MMLNLGLLGLARSNDDERLRIGDGTVEQAVRTGATGSAGTSGTGGRVDLVVDACVECVVYLVDLSYVE